MQTPGDTANNLRRFISQSILCKMLLKNKQIAFVSDGTASCRADDGIFEKGLSETIRINS